MYFQSIKTYYNYLKTQLLYHYWIKEKRSLKGLKNKHLGERCFIIGNGPSLLHTDLDQLQNEITFSCNMIFDMADKCKKWTPYYYFCHDPKYLENNFEEIFNVKAYKKLIGYYFDSINIVAVNYYKRNADYLYRILKTPRTSNSLEFSEDVSLGCYPVGSVSYAMLQFALFMGFKKIYLIGFDHSLDDKTGKTHFEGYSGNNINHINMDKLTKGFTKAREFCESRGIEIINCTRGGRLEVFKRIPLDEVLVSETTATI